MKSLPSQQLGAAAACMRLDWRRRAAPRMDVVRCQSLSSASHTQPDPAQRTHTRTHNQMHTRRHTRTHMHTL
eukprot:4169766-Pleurochrysis_carterae.AAC.1